MGVTSHGMSGTATYRCWANMVQRCTNPNNTYYCNYGGRGIKVSARWMVFENFLADMGVRPEGMTLDRWPDNDGDYRVENCRWATRSEQNLNNRRTRLLTHGGETMPISAWARKLDIREPKLRERLDKGWPLELALTLKPSKHNSVKRSGPRKRQVT